MSAGGEDATGGRVRPPLTQDAARLLTRSATGDASALGVLVDRFGGLVSACVGTVQADPAGRDRLCTDVFTAVWRRSREGARSPEPVLWVLEVLCETLGSAHELARRPLGSSLLALDCPDRELLLLAAAGGFSQAEISALTGIDEFRLRSILRNALEALQGRDSDLLTA
ncbi:RNA polymerase sigma factor [Rathayibacter sp. AY1G1]|uniref:RNA polymerase sigma factor n=1 Tax=Rathayibacter sp. AY1G1 TaxID=2080564 RepID=UPI0011B0253D|nr:sigma-70 family RNA polymerase sigma factor [Rathayibacter sp. AY1G1]